MAGPVIYPGGLGGSGPAIAGYENDYFSAATSGTVVWVNTRTGSDSNGGYEREKPKATLSSAFANVLSFGTIVIEADSHEELAAGITFNLAGVRVIGLGSGSHRPRYTMAYAGVMFDLTAAGVRFENIYFPASTAGPTDRIKIEAQGCEVKDCYFECGANDTSANGAVRCTTGGSYAHVTGTSFVSTASQPASGLVIDDTLSHIVVENCTFDGGSFGFSSYAWNVTAAAVGVVGINNTLANGADIGLKTGASFQLWGVNQTGGRVNYNL